MTPNSSNTGDTYADDAFAGEEGDASLVARTIEALGVSRIDHGVRAADDPAVMRRLVECGVTLTACPNSNVRLRVFPTMERSTIRTLLDAGVAVTIRPSLAAAVTVNANANTMDKKSLFGRRRPA